MQASNQSQMRLEMVSRTIAETGIRDLFRIIHALTLKQLVHLHHGQPVAINRVEPPDQPVPVGIEQPAGLTPPVAAMRTDLLHNLGKEQISQLILAAGPIEPQLDRGVDVTADRLAVHPRQLTDRPLTPAAQPQPQNFSHLEHANLPERHAAS